MTYTQPPPNLDSATVMKFFWLFTRFECVLKRKGYIKADRNQVPYADWSKFEAEMAPLLASKMNRATIEAISFLVNNPPKQQTVVNGKLDWVTHTRPRWFSEELFALRLVRTIRNNIFHGGKYPGEPIEEVGRDRKLLDAALQVLIQCAEIRQDFQTLLSHTA